jgi:hypothetical protein
MTMTAPVRGLLGRNRFAVRTLFLLRFAHFFKSLADAAGR